MLLANPFIKSKRSYLRKTEMKEVSFMWMDTIALVLVIIGALNWGSIGLFSFDLVGWIFGGQGAIVSRIIFTLVGLAGLWCISLLFRPRDVDLPEEHHRY